MQLWDGFASEIGRDLGFKAPLALGVTGHAVTIAVLP